MGLLDYVNRELGPEPSLMTMPTWEEASAANRADTGPKLEGWRDYEDASRQGVIDVLGAKRPVPEGFQTPELTDDESRAAKWKGTLAGLSALKTGGIFGGILAGIAGSKRYANEAIYDRYVERRMTEPGYGDKRTDRLMAQRYGAGQSGSAFIAPRSDRYPRSPKKIAKSVGGGMMQDYLYEENEEGKMVARPYGDPYKRSRKDSGLTLAQQGQASEIRAATYWWETLPPEKKAEIMSMGGDLLPAHEQKFLALLQERGLDESEADYFRRIQRLGLVPDPNAPPPPEPAPPPEKEPLIDWGAAADAAERKGRGILDWMDENLSVDEPGGASPRDVESLQESLRRRGLLSR